MNLKIGGVMIVVAIAVARSQNIASRLMLQSLLADRDDPDQSAQAGATPPSLFTAIQEQLGLRLE
jgi:hypothetical protein